MTTFAGPLLASSIKSAVAELLSQDVTIPDGHRGALVSVVNLDRIEVALATKVLDGDAVAWKVTLLGSHAWAGENQLAIINQLSW